MRHVAPQYLLRGFEELASQDPENPTIPHDMDTHRRTSAGIPRVTLTRPQWARLHSYIRRRRKELKEEPITFLEIKDQAVEALGFPISVSTVTEICKTEGIPSRLGTCGRRKERKEGDQVTALEFDALRREFAEFKAQVSPLIEVVSKILEQ